MVSEESNADICRRNDWVVGDILRVADETGQAWFRITAIGPQLVLGYQVASQEFGFGRAPCGRRGEGVIGVDLTKAVLI